jgi:hypothetical protein
MNSINVIDDFYDDPIKVVQMALCDQPSPCPGMRSQTIVNIDSDFYHKFKKEIFRLHNIHDDGRFVMTSYFNQITSFDDDLLNYNWPHIDGDVRYGDTTLTYENYNDKMILGGMIILCDIVDDLTTDFWTPKEMSRKELFDMVLYDYILTRDSYEKGNISLDEYKIKFVEFHNKFTIDERIKNKFNRMISWRAGSIRGQKMVSKKQGTKLTHNFYIHAPIVK